MDMESLCGENLLDVGTRAAGPRAPAVAFRFTYCILSNRHTRTRDGTRTGHPTAARVFFFSSTQTHTHRTQHTTQHDSRGEIIFSHHAPRVHVRNQKKKILNKLHARSHARQRRSAAARPGTLAREQRPPQAPSHAHSWPWVPAFGRQHASRLNSTPDTLTIQRARRCFTTAG